MNLKNELTNLNKYPFHMPGHKRNKKFDIIGSEIDITEIDGMDNLHDASGIILDIEERLCKIYKAEKSFISVNGASIGILAAIHSVCNRGDTVIVARNCHKSVYNACMLLELKVIFVYPDYDRTNGYYTRLSQQNVDMALSKHSDAKAVIITSPTYEGFISNIKTEVPLIVDCAHGAHFGISYFPDYPKADIVVSSLHKTLPALTQTAVVNVYNKKYINAIKKYMSIFQTTSPSYVLMNSIDICADYVESNKKEFGLFYEELCDLRLIETENIKIQYTDDITKIIVSTCLADIDGTRLGEMLREHGVEPELVSDEYVLLMTSIGDDKEALEKLKNILLDIDSQCCSKYLITNHTTPKETKEQIILVSQNEEETDIEFCVGKICNEFIYAYPPDIPILMPNQLIDRSDIEYIKEAIKSGINIVSDSGLLPNKILTKQI